MMEDETQKKVNFNKSKSKEENSNKKENKEEYKT